VHMNKLFVRLVASGAVAASMGATALASSASIDTTGPGSTNLITSSNRNSFSSNLRNRVDTGNWNYQNAKTGNVRADCNTKVYGFGGGSGNANNYNNGNNWVAVSNSGNNGNWSWGNGGGGNREASIFLTGPKSFNEISGGNNRSDFRSNVSNNVNAQNFSDQNARSGGVTISGNTVVSGVGGSGSATNYNMGVNTVQIDNQGNRTPGWLNGGNNGSAFISTTGPKSFNAIEGNNSNRVSENTTNNVNATNVNRQNATTGNVTITGNTVVRGVGGSGDASNYNSGMNDVGISNQ
jgi:hypothetical protein